MEYALDLLQKNADRKICADCTEKPRRLRIFFFMETSFIGFQTLVQ
jgi:hypothetical protein